jgi:hypothetical protein
MPYRVMLAWWALVCGVPVESVVPCGMARVCVCLHGDSMCACVSVAARGGKDTPMMAPKVMAVGHVPGNTPSGAHLQAD